MKRLAAFLVISCAFGCETESSSGLDRADMAVPNELDGSTFVDSRVAMPDAELVEDSAANGADAAADAFGLVGDASIAADVGQDFAVVDDCSDRAVFATEVVAFEPGSNAGYGQRDMPGIVLGPPDPGLPTSGSLDVVSLGAGGVIVLGFGDSAIIDGPGFDFIVWENPFWVGGDESAPFAEFGEVSVSSDGEQWLTFPCNPLLEDRFDPGCAGWRPRTDFDLCDIDSIGPESMGGDAFDLADLNVERVRYVRIRDLSDTGRGMAAGFDLDGVGIIHAD